MLLVIGKLVWLLAKPSNLIAIILLVGLVALWLGRRRLGTSLVAIGTIPLAVLAILPVGSWLLIPLENRFPLPVEMPREVDGVVGLAGPENLEVTAARGQPILGDSAERLLAMIELGRQYPDARLVYSGGSDVLFGSPMTSAAVARSALLWAGFDVDRVLFEDQARDTYENALRSKELAKPRPGGRWLLVTTANHMPRAVGVFRKAGWDVIPYPVDYRTTGRIELGTSFEMGSRLADLDYAAHEWLGLLAYRILGHTDVLFPAPRND
jgi:uncharacterized SAM-binding protein YcdF (DUF218 family)